MKGKFRYCVMGAIMLTILINVIDKGSISYAQADIIKQYHFNAITWGVVLSYFGYGFSLGSFAGGWLADRKGPKWAWVVFGLSWCVFEALTAYAGDIGIVIFGGAAIAGFGVVRTLLGFFEGPIWPVNTRTVYNWSPPKERATVLGTVLVASPFGSLITAPIVVFILIATGWRSMFLILGIVGFVITFAWTRFFTDRPEDNKFVSKEELDLFKSGDVDTKLESADNQERVPWYNFFNHRQLVLNLVAVWATNYLVFFVWTWIPKYLQDFFHVQLLSLWYLGMIPWILGCFTVFYGGRTSDYIIKKYGNYRLARPGIIAMGCAVIAICCSFIPFTGGKVLFALSLLSIAVGANYFINPLNYAIVMDNAEKSMVGTYTGVMNLIGSTAAFIAPLVTGVIVQYVGYQSIFIPPAGLAVIAVIAQYFIKPPTTFAVTGTSSISQ